MSFRYKAILLAASLALLGAQVAAAQTEYDAPSIAVNALGHGKAVVTITAGDSGAPEGFTFWWMTRAEFDEYGSAWPAYPIDEEAVASFTGTPTLNTGDGAYTHFTLGPNESIVVELGDLFDETGVTLSAEALQELDQGVEYVFCAYANGSAVRNASPVSATSSGTTTNTTSQNCTFTQGYWKTHGPIPTGNNTNVWPVNNLTLGTVNYTDLQLLSILNEQANGNGLISLAHQLIAAKLNIANGADGSSIATAIAQADAAIGGLVVPPVGSDSLSPGSTSALTQSLDNYNQGISGPGHCAEVGVQQSTWGVMKARYR